MSYGTDISATLPEVLSAEPTAAQALRSWCDEVDARLVAKVTPAGFNANADLSLNTTYGLTAAQFVAFAAAAAVKTGAGNARKVYVYNGELYFTNGSGTTVRLTNNGQLDIGSVQGITGDYSADANAEVDYTTSTTLYRFLSHLSNLARAHVEVGKLRVRGTANNPSYYIEMGVPSLAASYAFNLPTGLPVSTSLLEWTSAGQIQSQRSPTLAAVTLDSDGDVTVSGSGEYNHGDKSYTLSSLHYALGGGSLDQVVGSGGAYGEATGGTTEGLMPLFLRSGWRLKTVSVDYYGGGGSAPTLQVYRSSTTTRTAVGSSWGTGSSGVQIDLTSAALNHTVNTAGHYYLSLVPGQTGDRFGRVLVTYDVP